jgi:hypothetical protein
MATAAAVGFAKGEETKLGEEGVRGERGWEG